MANKHNMSAADREQPSRQGAFHKLATEMLWQIAGYLDNDRDLWAFRSVCQLTRTCIDGGFWHARFRSKFALDISKAPDSVKLGTEYWRRSKWLRRGAVVDFGSRGNERREKGVLNILRILIDESFSGGYYLDANGRPRCPNQDCIIQFIKNSRAFLCASFRPPVRQNSAVATEEPFYAIQLMCAQLLFNFDPPRYGLLSFEDSQQMVYSHMRDEPIFRGSGNVEINMRWVMHCFSFFHRHMISDSDDTLRSLMQELEAPQSPSAWQGPLVDGPYELSRSWKGTYSYLELHELEQIRAIAQARRSNRMEDYDNDIFIDKNIDTDSAIQELELRSLDEGQIPWPHEFETRLHSRRQTVSPRTRAQQKRAGADTCPKSIRIQGEGVDAKDEFHASGWINPLAPQYGIKGWQRITMMKHFNPDYSQVDTDDLWAYEGVVLPGGRIILGRWWNASPDPNHPDYGCNSGPFIWWAVDYLDSVSVAEDNSD
ncbi:uncharacterized protein EI97DRAFT_283724 [Westerdykella ornata]|uniref:F-box domain-containing protein n=1 Tax=Westerdykella ornata TaxID=318751 RepID=A0A6A6J4A0_WESOR|nr:uncharacterized protein EI97DRAFT_283724 [Westerdykella ornata]KAF2271401.1 hypothetical protein EI97DRAFT_283724 [Westerdykella ornata]